jgi:hypothetical protein
MVERSLFRAGFSHSKSIRSKALISHFPSQTVQTIAAKMQPELRMRCLPHIPFRVVNSEGLNDVQTVLSKE